MHPVIAAIGRHAAAHRRRVALTDGERSMTYAALNQAIAEAGAALRSASSRPVAILMENSPEWIVTDLALAATRLACVPLPSFFSAQQQAHCVADAGVELIVTDQPDECLARMRSAGLPAAQDTDLQVAGRRLARVRVAVPAGEPLPPGTAKVTYTSGTTGKPKGVRLDARAISMVARSLATACGLGARDLHLSALPLATLLENIGVYAMLIAGARCQLLPLHLAGVLGASGLRPRRLLETLRRGAVTTTILVPQMLKELVEALESGAPAPTDLRFVAVGGAAVAPALIRRARAAGLPAYEGYGLSECASVVTLNTASADRIGSAGRPLPHCVLSFAPDGEILVSGATLLGYHGCGAAPGEAWPTGDIGHMDEDGFLHIGGRKKDCFVTSFGRNVSPEWIEAALTLEPPIAQAWVTGESQPWVAAVISPRPGHGDAEVDAAVHRVNHDLPDYARVRRWIRAAEPFSIANGQLTANGRARRTELWARYASLVNDLYRKEQHEPLRAVAAGNGTGAGRAAGHSVHP